MVTRNTLPTIATNKWEAAISKDLYAWMLRAREEYIVEASKKFRAAQLLDPEYGLETYRWPNLEYVFLKMPRYAPKIDHIMGRMEIKLFDFDYLNEATTYRSDIRVVPSWNKKSGKAITIKGHRERAHPYWAIIEYGSRMPKTHFLRYFETASGGLAVFMQRRTAGSGAGKVKYLAQARAKQPTGMLQGAKYFRAWPSSGGTRILHHIQARAQKELEAEVVELTQKHMSVLFEGGTAP